jgi:hypothetical protein
VLRCDSIKVLRQKLHIMWKNVFHSKHSVAWLAFSSREFYQTGYLHRRLWGSQKHWSAHQFVGWTSTTGVAHTN